MATYNHEKKYWLQLRRDFFKRHDIRILESMTNGKEYSLFYMKLMVESIDHYGELRFSETMPYTEEMLATITDTNIDIARSALNALYQLDMIRLKDDGTICIPEVNKLIGFTTVSAEKKQEQRAHKVEGWTGGGQLSTKEKDKDILINNIKESIDMNKKIYMPTHEEISYFIAAHGYSTNPTKFERYYQSILLSKGATAPEWTEKLIEWGEAGI